MSEGSVEAKKSTSSFKQCSDCRAVSYCSRKCQQKHWRQHKTLCQAISSLEERKYREDREKTGVFVSHLSPQEHAQVVRLVGRKCTVKCVLGLRLMPSGILELKCLLFRVVG